MRVDAEVVLDTVAVAIIPVVQRARQVELPVFAGAISCACVTSWAWRIWSS